mgnify:CR=1 FL=1
MKITSAPLCTPSDEYSVDCPCPHGFSYCSEDNLQPGSTYESFGPCCDLQGTQAGWGGCYCDGVHYDPNLGRDSSDRPISCTGVDPDPNDSAYKWRPFESYDPEIPKPDNCWFEVYSNVSTNATNNTTFGSNVSTNPANNTTVVQTNGEIYGFRHENDDGETRHREFWQGSVVVAALVFATLGFAFCSHFVFGSKRYRKDYEKVNQFQ